ncbi:MAG TPA: tyrosine-type recombinase/integrase [Candidatus Sulfotelmatobacter sp.]|nr:tyrosine-type recombinase/integrase [Candidatus Sulfotelmatobacter sp.]
MPGRAKPYTHRVKILKYVKAGDTWRFANVVERNGRIVRDHVLIMGHDEHHREGSYYLEWYEHGKRYRKAVADFATVAEAARLKAIEVEALKAGVMSRPTQPATMHANGVTLATAVDRYLAMVEAQRSHRTYISYRYTLKKLLVPCYEKNSVDQVAREDILAFMTRCYELGLGHRTVYDKLVVVLQLFKRHGKSGLMASSDWPKYVETIRPIYEPEEIQSMFKHATEEEAIFLKFMLGSGFRDQEAQHVCWRDLDFRHSQVRVTAKALWDFRPKNWEERVVPLPSALIDQLQRLKEKRNAVPAQLLFPNKRGNPNSENDTIVKRVAHRAKLNCGQCVTKHGNRCAEGPYCHHFFLHKFRHTFAIEHLRHGVDIRTLQTWMGHRDIKSTMVYLKGVQSKDVLTKVNAGALAAYVAD